MNRITKSGWYWARFKGHDGSLDTIIPPVGKNYAWRPVYIECDDGEPWVRNTNDSGDLSNFLKDEEIGPLLAEQEPRTVEQPTPAPSGRNPNGFKLGDLVVNDKGDTVVLLAIPGENGSNCWQFGYIQNRSLLDHYCGSAVYSAGGSCLCGQAGGFPKPISQADDLLLAAGFDARRRQLAARAALTSAAADLAAVVRARELLGVLDRHPAQGADDE